MRKGKFVTLILIGILSLALVGCKEDEKPTAEVSTVDTEAATESIESTESVFNTEENEAVESTEIQSTEIESDTEISNDSKNTSGSKNGTSDKKTETKTGSNSGTTSQNTATTTPCPYPLYTIIDEGGYNIYFYGHWGGSANQPADIYAKTDECINQVCAIGLERLKAEYGVTQYTSYRTENCCCSWEPVGEYAEGTIVRRFYIPGQIIITGDATPPQPEPEPTPEPTPEPQPEITEQPVPEQSEGM